MDRLTETLIGMGFAPESIPEASGFSTTTEGMTLKDADTLRMPDRKNLRLKGINAAETAKFLPESGTIKGAQGGADLQTQSVRDIINEGGYDTPVYPDEKDKYKRELGDLSRSNAPGQKTLTNTLLEKGIVDLTKSSDEEQRISAAFGNLRRSQRQFEDKRTEGDELFEKITGEKRPGGYFIPKVHTTTAKEFNSADRDYFIGPASIGPNENYKGEAKNQWSTGLSIGTGQMKQGLWGALEMLGDRTGSDWLRDIGTSNVRFQESVLADLPYLRSGEAFNDKNEWQLDTLGKFVDYAIGSAASNAPQMLTTIVSTLAAPVTFGASLAVPGAIYIGQTWNGQEDNNKNAGAAIASGITQTALDKIGLKGFGAGALDITKATTQTLIKNELAKKGIVGEAADAMIVKATKESVKEVAQILKAETLKQSIGPKAIMKATAHGAATEAPTEFLQEIAGYMGEKVTFDITPEDPTEQAKLKNRLANAAFGGLVLGGGMSGAGATIQTLTARNGVTDETSDMKYRKDWMDNNQAKQMFSTADVLNRVTDEAQAEINLEKLAEAEESKRAIQGSVKSWWADKGVNSLWDKMSNTIMKGKAHADEHMATLSTLLGATRAVNGASIDEHQALLATNIYKGFGTKEEAVAAFKGMTPVQISEMFSDETVLSPVTRWLMEKKASAYKSVRDVASFSKADLGKYEEHREAILEYADRMDNLVSAYNGAVPDSKITVDQFLHRKPLDKSLVSRYSGEFAKALQDTLKITPEDASRLVNTMLYNHNVTDLDDSLDSLLNPDAGRMNPTLLLNEINKPENRGKFSKYMSNNLIDNAFSLSNKGAATNTNRNLIGQDGKLLAGLIQISKEKGTIDDATASFMAKEVKDYLALRNGVYRPPLNPYIKGALSTLNFLATITSLPLAAISSTVEFAQVYRNLNTPQAARATMGILKSTGKEMSAILREIGSAVSPKVSVQEAHHRTELAQAGYLREGGIAHRTDVLTGYFQKWTEGFFKVTGLTSITTITRHARLGLAADAIQNWTETVRNQENPQRVQDAYENLIRIGVDPEFLMSGDANLTANEKKLDTMMQLGAYNFVNEAVIMPTQLNRPKFYSDPYLQLFTQFQGYTSAFTATVLPRLVKDLGRSGSDEQKNAGAVIAMMLAFTLLSLYIKDLIKYGESPPEWLKEEKKFQRVVGAMGILGTGQRLWDVVDPMFESRKPTGVASTIWKNISEQSPQLSYINKVDDMLSAKDNKQIEKAARLLPIAGTSPQFAKYLQKELGE